MSNLFGNLLIKEMAIVVLCSVYTQNRHPPPPIQSIRSAFTNVGRKGQDIANDYSIKLEVSAFRLHFDYTYVLRYLVTTDLVEGTTYTRAERKVRSGTGTGCKLLNNGFHTIITGLE